GAPPVRGVHLGTGRDASRTAAVSWSTAGSVAGAVLEVGTDTTYGTRIAVEGRAVRGWSTVYRHAVVPGLQPDTRYAYRISHRGATPVTGTFRTAPLGGTRPLRFAAFGDMGTTAAARSVTALLRRSRPDVALLVGDLCYANPGGGTRATAVDQRVWDAWFEQVRASAAAAPWLPAVGNHEIEVGYGELGYDGFFARFALPGGGAPGGRATWAVRYGSVAFVALDANDASHEIPRNRGYLGAAQDRWLDSTLGALRRDLRIDFVVVGFHHCAFSTNAAHGSDAGVRDRWAPLFDRHGVDLVVNGHNHSYERTHPVRAGKPTRQAPKGAVVEPARDGTTYVLAGGGGATAYRSQTYPESTLHVAGGRTVRERAPWSAVRYLDHSLVLGDVTPATPTAPARLRLSAVAPDGTVVDAVVLERPRPA
ncbi:MAG: Calcineurin-like phosphoesterase, partial [Frankiales bacterium]|nr:Calcineurin-like phosphoesterase [Frankiales bacterium]